jgi:dimethylargininase
MKRTYGSQSMIAPLRRVLVKRPDETFGQADPVRWHYSGRPDLEIAQGEHLKLVKILRKAGAEVLYHEDVPPGLADSIFVHDPAIVTDYGAIILKMGKELRRGEEMALSRCFITHGVPVIYALRGEARAEGGDLLWVDHDTLAVGLGPRTNKEGLRQLNHIMSELGVMVLPVELPSLTGTESCLHLMSMISFVDTKLAVVYMPLLPVPFREFLGERGFELLPAPMEEVATMGTNVLALAPGKCLMLEGNPITQKRLKKAGCKVYTFRGDEIALKTEGGPTCLTRPILREY